MHIRQRNDSWTVDYVDSSGKRRRKDFKELRKAQNYLNCIQVKIDKGIEVSTTRDTCTLRDCINKTYNTIWKDRSNGMNALRNAELIADIIGPETMVSGISTEVIDFVKNQLKKQGNSDSTVNNKISALMVCLRFAKDRGYIEQLPTYTRYKPSKGRLRFFSESEEQLIIKAHKEIGQHSFADFVKFLIDTGLRTGEARALKYADIQLRDGRWMCHVWDTKNGDFRVVPLTQKSVETLQSMCPCDLQDAHTDLRVRLLHPFDYTSSSIRTQWDRVRSLLGHAEDKEFVPHLCRHTCASRLVQKGVPLKVVQEWMGHKSIQVTLRYAKLQPDQLFEALETMEKN